MIPTILRQIGSDCSFTVDIEEGEAFNVENYTLSDAVPVVNGNAYKFPAVFISGDNWAVREIDSMVYPNALNPTNFYASVDNYTCDGWAFPIDPRMTKADIEGANRIEANSTNDGWLFFHTEPGTHHDHEIQVVSAISGLIEPLICKYQLDVLDADSDTKKKKARDGIAALKVFYNLLLTNAQKVSRSAYLGQRVKEPHPAKGHLHNDLVSTYNAAKMELSKNRTKALKDDLDLMDNILAMQTPETRWDMAARIEAEKKAEEQNDNT